MKLNIKKKYFYHIIFLLTAIIMSFKMNFTVDFQIIYIDGYIGSISFFIGLIYFVFFVHIFYRDNGDETKISLRIIKLFFRLVISMVIMFIFLLFLEPTNFVHYYVIKNSDNIKKDSVCAVINDKFYYVHHGLTTYTITYDKVLKKKYSLQVSKNCYNKHKIGDTVKILYHYKKGLIYYIDYSIDSIMYCPNNCDSRDLSAHYFKLQQKDSNPNSYRDGTLQ